MSLDWKHVISAGFAAGLIFLIVEMVLVGVVMGTPFGPPRMMAAIVMGTGVLPPPPTFDLGIFVVAMLVHFGLSFVLAAIYALLIARFAKSLGAAIVAGLVFGAVVYFVNFYIMTGAFPWFANARNWITIVAHLIFGLVIGVMSREIPVVEHREPAEPAA